MINVLRYHAPHDVGVAHDARKSAVLSNDQSCVVPLLAHHLTHCQNAVVQLADQRLLRPQLAYGVSVLDLALHFHQFLFLQIRTVAGVVFLVRTGNSSHRRHAYFRALISGVSAEDFQGRRFLLGHDLDLGLLAVQYLDLLLLRVLQLELVHGLLQGSGVGEFLRFYGLAQFTLGLVQLSFKFLAAKQGAPQALQVGQLLLLLVR